MSFNARRYEKPRIKRQRVNELKRRFVRVKCTECGYVGSLIGHTHKRTANGTANCGKCGMLLLIERGKAYNFHQYMHAQDKRWPADGANTYSVEV